MERIESMESIELGQRVEFQRNGETRLQIKLLEKLPYSRS